MSAIFVTGTDTGVGKTLVSKALIDYFVARGDIVAAMKPVAAGAKRTQDGLRNDDAEILLRASNAGFSYDQINPYVFEPPISPQIAAKLENSLIEIKRLDAALDCLLAGSETLIIEGAGGWQVPLTPTLSFADWVSCKQWPVILVVGVRLGCINHARLTSLDIRQKNNRLLGWVANIIDPDTIYIDEVVASLQASIEAPLLGEIPFLSGLTEKDVMGYLDFQLIDELL